jgi:hypothetical protein
MPWLQQYWGEFAINGYQYLKVKDKTVVDIGADFGNSPYWFLMHGAAKVIAYESDKSQNHMLHNNFDPFPSLVEIHDTWLGAMPIGDILKIDCEGCEVLLAADYISRFSQYAIALHPDWIPKEKYDMLKGAILDSGGRFVYATPDKKEEVYVKTI